MAEVAVLKTVSSNSLRTLQPCTAPPCLTWGLWPNMEPPHPLYPLTAQGLMTNYLRMETVEPQPPTLYRFTYRPTVTNLPVEVQRHATSMSSQLLAIFITSYLSTFPTVFFYSRFCYSSFQYVLYNKLLIVPKNY